MTTETTTTTIKVPGFGTLRLRGHRWWIRYSYLGRRREESTGTSDQKKAERLLRQRIQECGRGRRIDPTAEHRVTMAALLDALVTDYTINNRRSTKDLGYRIAPLREAFGDRRALDVTAARVGEYVRDRLKAGMANASVNRELAALKRSFKLGLEQERLGSAPTIKLLREPPRGRDSSSPATSRRSWRHLPDDLRDYARFCYSTGTRKAEAAALAWSDVDREAGRITFRRETAKSGEPRVIPLVGELAAIIERRWAARTLGARIIPSVFHREGRPIRSFRKAWRPACAEAGHAGLLFHDLRRSAVRNLVGPGVDSRWRCGSAGTRPRACSSATGSSTTRTSAPRWSARRRPTSAPRRAT